MNNKTMTQNSYVMLNNDISIIRKYEARLFDGRKKATCAFPNCNNECYPNDGSMRIITPSHKRGITICSYHVDFVGSYSHENDDFLGKITDDGITVSCELETSENTTISRAVLSCDFECYPSDDGSLDGCEPIEWKTPVYNSKQGFTKLLGTFEGMLDKNYIEMDDSCGSHLHTGLSDNSIDFRFIFDTMDEYYQAFKGVYEYLENMDSYHMIQYFGRDFVPYACYVLPLDNDRYGLFNKENGNIREVYHNADLYGTGSYDCNVHRLAFNFQHSYSMEFRLAKFTSAKQYRKIAIVCMNMVIALRDYHNKAVTYSHLKPFNVTTLEGLNNYFVALFKENFPY